MMAEKLERIAAKVLRGEYKRIAILTGAGISCASGIPDFRSPGGLYATLRPELLTATPSQIAYLRDDPTGVVDISIFKYNQFPYLEVRRPFILGTEQGLWKPTIAHIFSRVARERDVLTRVYDQNIDGLHYGAGLDENYLVCVHGSLAKVACEFCGESMAFSEFCGLVKTNIKNIYDPTDTVAPSESTNILCPSCCKPGMKPNTVLFGTNLPKRAFACFRRDFPGEVDLLIIAGTSLTVQPAASLVSLVSPGTPRILINLDRVGDEVFRFDDPASEDVFLQSSCDAGFLELATRFGWLSELRRYSDLLCDQSKRSLAEAAV